MAAYFVDPAGPGNKGQAKSRWRPVIDSSGVQAESLIAGPIRVGVSIRDSDRSGSYRGVPSRLRAVRLLTSGMLFGSSYGILGSAFIDQRLSHF